MTKKQLIEKLKEESSSISPKCSYNHELNFESMLKKNRKNLFIKTYNDCLQEIIDWEKESLDNRGVFLEEKKD